MALPPPNPHTFNVQAPLLWLPQAWNMGLTPASSLWLHTESVKLQLDSFVHPNFPSQHPLGSKLQLSQFSHLENQLTQEPEFVKKHFEAATSNMPWEDDRPPTCQVFTKPLKVTVFYPAIIPQKLSGIITEVEKLQRTKFTQRRLPVLRELCTCEGVWGVLLRLDFQCSPFGYVFLY